MMHSDNHSWLETPPRILGGIFVFIIGFLFLWTGVGLAIGLISEPGAIKAIIIMLRSRQ
jgi:hypothetical protein